MATEFTRCKEIDGSFRCVIAAESPHNWHEAWQTDDRLHRWFAEVITPAHLVHGHGYSLDYAAGLSPVDREAEHNRLHADATANYLDHTHGEVKV